MKVSAIKSTFNGQEALCFTETHILAMLGSLREDDEYNDREALYLIVILKGMLQSLQEE